MAYSPPALGPALPWLASLSAAASAAMAARAAQGPRHGAIEVARRNLVTGETGPGEARGWSREAVLPRLGRTPWGRLLPVSPSLMVRWEAAGGEGAIDGLRGARLLWAAWGTGAILALGVLARPVLMLLPLGTLAGLRLHTMVLTGQARRRRDRIAAHVPDLVELLVATTAAGLSPLTALRRAGAVLAGPLGEQLRRAAADTELGVPWREAMEAMAARTEVPSLRRLVSALNRSQRLGTSIGSTLRGVTEDLRAERRARAEEMARRAPVKMLFPLVFLILPAFLLLTVGPVVLSTLRSLSLK